MNFTIEIDPGSTYHELSRHLGALAAKFNGVQEKPEHNIGPIEIRECGGIVGVWRIEK